MLKSNQKTRAVLTNQKGISGMTVVGSIVVGVVMVLGLTKFDKQVDLINASQNRQALTYEANQYCQPASNGVTVKVINPKGRFETNETVQEQWIPLEKLTISASQTDDARLMTLDDATYRLDLPTVGVCQRTESAPALS